MKVSETEFEAANQVAFFGVKSLACNFLIQYWFRGPIIDLCRVILGWKLVDLNGSLFNKSNYIRRNHRSKVAPLGWNFPLKIGSGLDSALKMCSSRLNLTAIAAQPCLSLFRCWNVEFCWSLLDLCLISKLGWKLWLVVILAQQFLPAQCRRSLYLEFFFFQMKLWTIVFFGIRGSSAVKRKVWWSTCHGPIKYRFIHRW